jgi:hypothetical protein
MEYLDFSTALQYLRAGATVVQNGLVTRLKGVKIRLQMKSGVITFHIGLFAGQI